MANVFLPTLHCHEAGHPNLFSTFFYCFFSPLQKPAWRLWARAQWLEPKRRPDDNDEVSSHPANESPDLPRVCLLCKFPSHQQWIKGVANQCFSSQHFSKAIIHKGHAKGTHTLGASMHTYMHTEKDRVSSRNSPSNRFLRQWQMLKTQANAYFILLNPMHTSLFACVTLQSTVAL